VDGEAIGIEICGLGATDAQKRELSPHAVRVRSDQAGRYPRWRSSEPGLVCRAGARRWSVRCLSGVSNGDVKSTQVMGHGPVSEMRGREASVLREAAAGPD
jgi:hypothetical protein